MWQLLSLNFPENLLELSGLKTGVNTPRSTGILIHNNEYFAVDQVKKIHNYFTKFKKISAH